MTAAQTVDPTGDQTGKLPAHEADPTSDLHAGPAAGPTVAIHEVAGHHTAERRAQLSSMAAGCVETGRNLRANSTTPWKAWQQIAMEWLEEDDESTHAYERLVLRLDRYQDVLRHRKLCRAGGQYGSALRGLAALAHHHRQWIRPPEEWTSQVERNGIPQRVDQFSSLARHLFARYDVPTFLDEAWFAERSDEAIRQQKWFIHVGAGGSVRELDTPVHLTRRMAHEFLQRNNRESIAHNLRWIQVLGMGGDAVMARAVQRTRLGRHLDHDEFWSTVVLFLASNPMIDPTLVGPVVDYIHHMRFAPSRVVREGGGVDEAPPPQPDFTMKGRSITKLLRQVEAWHGHLARVKDVVFQSWQPCGLRPFELEEDSPALGRIRWSVQELLSSWELAAEGTAMGHCVVSYSDQCADGQTSIWSIGLLREGDQTREGALTVAVDPERRVITQARGKYNMLPHSSPRSAQAQEAARAGYMDILNGSAAVLARWGERERLRRQD